MDGVEFGGEIGASHAQDSSRGRSRKRYDHAVEVIRLHAGGYDPASSSFGSNRLYRRAQDDRRRR